MTLDQEASELGLSLLRKGAAQLHEVSQGGQGRHPRIPTALPVMMGKVMSSRHSASM